MYQHLATHFRPPAAPFHAAVERGRILIITQGEDLHDRFARALHANGFRAVTSSEKEAIGQVRGGSFAFVILDADIDPLGALDTLRKIRGESGLPVIMVTRDSLDETDYVVALELGADDFLGPSLSPRELLARARAILRRQELARRSSASNDRGGFRFHGYELRRRTRTLADPTGKEVVLTKSEYGLLTAFLEAPGRILSRLHLMRATRLHEDVCDRSMDVQVLRLRRKLQNGPADLQPITTHRGIGYSFDAPVEIFL